MVRDVSYSILYLNNYVGVRTTTSYLRICEFANANQISDER